LIGEAETPVGIQLAQRIQRGDRAAEEQFVLRYRDRIFAVALAKLGNYDAAEDVTQEALVSVLQGLREGKVREPEKLGAFACGTARHIASNRLRFERRHPEEQWAGLESSGGNPEERLSRHEDRRLVRKILEQLDLVDQKILLWSLVDGLSSDEIGRRLGRRADTVRQRKRRALERVRKQVGEVSQNPRSGHKKREAL